MGRPPSGSSPEEQQNGLSSSAASRAPACCRVRTSVSVRPRRADGAIRHCCDSQKPTRDPTLNQFKKCAWIIAAATGLRHGDVAAYDLRREHGQPYRSPPCRILHACPADAPRWWPRAGDEPERLVLRSQPVCRLGMIATGAGQTPAGPAPRASRQGRPRTRRPALRPARGWRTASPPSTAWAAGDRHAAGSTLVDGRCCSCREGPSMALAAALAGAVPRRSAGEREARVPAVAMGNRRAGSLMLALVRGSRRRAWGL